MYISMFEYMCRIHLIPHRISLGFPRGPDFDTQLFAERGVTVEKLLGELYEKVYIYFFHHFRLALNVLKVSRHVV